MRRAEISEDYRCPILLPSKHHVTDLIIEKIHRDNYHAGIQGTLSAIRHRFWIADGKNQVRKMVKKCVRCIRHRPDLLYARMGDLPESRVRATGVFAHVRIDFFGPIFIKEKKLRNRNRVKAYGCIFICMTVKAVHIEITSDLTTKSFLGALRRFIGKRGVPKHIYSDNGTNFVGANKQLRELYVPLNSEEFKNNVNAFAVQKNIVWHFAPPLSPHFGGIWEAAVKSFKHHFRRTVGGQLLMFETFHTMTVEIEAILNSRTICSISTDPNDPLALTPAHFLIRRPMTMLHESDFSSVPENRLSTWHYISKV